MQVFERIRRAGNQRRMSTAGVVGNFTRAAMLLGACLLGGVGVAGAQASAVRYLGVQSTVATQAGNGIGAVQGLALDAAGDLFAADTTNNRVIEIPKVNGVLNSAGQTVVVAGLSGPSGVALDAQANLYISDTGSNRVIKVPFQAGAYNASGLVVVAAGLNQPAGVALDTAGNVYIADTGNNRVLKVAASGVQSTVGSSIPAPTGIAVDSHGNVFVAEYFSNAVIEVPAGSGAQSIVSSNVVNPAGLALDAAGALYIADSGNNRVVKVPVLGSSLNTAGQLTVATLLNLPTGIAVDSTGKLYIANSGSSQILQLDPGKVNLGSAFPGTSTPVAGLLFYWDQAGTVQNVDAYDQGVKNLDFQTGTGSTSTANASFRPGDTCTLNVYFKPTVAGGIRPGTVLLQDTASPTPDLVTVALNGTALGAALAFSPDKQIILAPAAASGTQSAIPPFNALGIAVDGLGNVFLTAPYNGQGQVTYLPAGGGTPVSIGQGLNRPFGLTLDPLGNVFIADTYNRRVVRLAAGTGVQTTVAGSFSLPEGIAVDAAGNLYVADPGAGAVFLLPASGAPQTTIGTGLVQPTGVAVDGLGNVYVADSFKSSIIKIPASGGPQTSLGSGFQQPASVAVDGVGDLYVADTFNNSVVVVPTSGGTQFNLGSGLNAPSAAAVSNPNNVYIADTNNGRVVEDIRNVAPSLNFPNTTVGNTAQLTLMLQSIGGSSLVFSQIFTTNQQGGNFTVDSSSTCVANTPVLPGQACTLVVDFNPQATGTSLGQLTLQDNATNMPQTQQIQLTGASFQTLSSFTITGKTTIFYGDTVSQFAITANDLLGHTDLTFNGAQTVTITGPAGAIVPVTFNAGVAVFTLPVLGPGPYQIQISAGSVSQTLNLLVVRAPVAISGTGLTVNIGQSGTAQITVAGPFTPPGIVHPSGPLSYSLDGGPATQVTLANGQAGVPIPATLALGNHTLTMTYPGDQNYLAGATTLTVTVTLTAQTITIVAPSPVTYGTAPIVITATSSSGLPVTLKVMSGPGVLSGTASGSSLTVTGAGVVVVEADQPGNTTYAAAPPTLQSITVLPAPLTAAIASVSIAYGSALPTTYPTQVTGTLNGDTVGTTLGLAFNYTPMPAQIPLVGTYAVGATLTGSAAGNYVLTVRPGTLTVTRAAVAVTLSSSNANVYVGTSVTFTSTVVGSIGTPTGTVSFYDGTTLLGMSALAGPAGAAYTTSSLAVGAHVITAVYSGDATFQALTSAPLTQTILAPSYLLTPSTPTLTLRQGQTGVVGLTFTPTGGFTGTVTFTCTGLPYWADCTYVPAKLTANGSNTPQTTVMTIITLGPNKGTVNGGTVTGPVGQSQPLFPGRFAPVAALVFFAPGMLMGGWAFGRRRGVRPGRGMGVVRLLTVLVMCGGLMAMAGCGFKDPLVPVGSSTVTITGAATSGAVTVAHTTTLTLIITP